MVKPDRELVGVFNFLANLNILNLAHFVGADHLDHTRNLLGFWIIALLTLPLAIWFWFLPEPSAHLKSDDQNHSPIPFLLSC